MDIDIFMFLVYLFVIIMIILSITMVIAYVVFAVAAIVAYNKELFTQDSEDSEFIEAIEPVVCEDDGVLSYRVLPDDVKQLYCVDKCTESNTRFQNDATCKGDWCQIEAEEKYKAVVLNKCHVDEDVKEVGDEVEIPCDLRRNQCANCEYTETACATNERNDCTKVLDVTIPSGYDKCMLDMSSYASEEESFPPYISSMLHYESSCLPTECASQSSHPPRDDSPDGYVMFGDAVKDSRGWYDIHNKILAIKIDASHVRNYYRPEVVRNEPKVNLKFDYQSDSLYLNVGISKSLNELYAMDNTSENNMNLLILPGNQVIYAIYAGNNTPQDRPLARWEQDNANEDDNAWIRSNDFSRRYCFSYYPELNDIRLNSQLTRSHTLCMDTRGYRGWGGHDFKGMNLRPEDDYYIYFHSKARSRVGNFRFH